MSTYLNRQELVNKADYEGGFLDLVFGYGLSLDDLPEDDEELRNLVGKLLDIKPVLERLYEILPEPSEDDWLLDED